MDVNLEILLCNPISFSMFVLYYRSKYFSRSVVRSLWCYF